MKKKIKIACSIFLALGFFAACKPESHTGFHLAAMNTGQNEAKNTYLTKDHTGNTVLCWTEMDAADSLHRLKFAYFDSRTGEFGDALTVAGSEGTSTGAESMAKVAFKSDGTIIAVFSKRFENEKNPFAGAIYYSLSADGGKNWENPKFLHSDTSRAYGRSFFDLATLKNGEIAAVWLDGRFGKTLKGSALFFAATEKGQGFTTEKCLQKGICECCRTDIICDEEGNIHIAYRDIEVQDMLGKQVRDMAYIFSGDNGQTFTDAKPISNDQWQIEGCPHSGPTLAVKNQVINAVWFTAGGGPGLYYTRSQLPGAGFNSRTLLTPTGKHPQMIALQDGRLAIACDESGHEEPPAKKDHSESMAMNHQAKGGSAKIMLRILADGKEERKMEITDGAQADHHAVLTPIDGGALLAWTRDENGRSKVYYTRIAID